MGNEFGQTTSPDAAPPKGGLVGTAIGLAVVALCGLAMFWLWSLPPIDPAKSRGEPYVLEVQEVRLAVRQFGFVLLAAVASVGWLVFFLTRKGRAIVAAASTKERLRSRYVRFALCTFGLGWMSASLYFALWSGAAREATGMIGFLTVAPLGFVFWHLGYSTIERDRRLGWKKHSEK